MSVSSSFMNSNYLRDICWKVDRDGTPFHDCFTDNTILLVGLLAGLILFHEFEATLQVTTDSYWFFFFFSPYGSRPLAHEHKCEVN
jgi:hypothetical protein